VVPKSSEKKSFEPEVLGQFQPYSPCMDDQAKNDSSKEMLLDGIGEGMQNHIPSTLHFLDEFGTFPTPNLNQEGVLGSSSSPTSVLVLGSCQPSILHKAQGASKRSKEGGSSDQGDPLSLYPFP
jgi:hypothetical protein